MSFLHLGHIWDKWKGCSVTFHDFMKLGALGAWRRNFSILGQIFEFPCQFFQFPCLENAWVHLESERGFFTIFTISKIPFKHGRILRDRKNFFHTWPFFTFSKTPGMLGCILDLEKDFWKIPPLLGICTQGVVLAHWSGGEGFLENSSSPWNLRPRRSS